MDLSTVHIGVTKRRPKKRVGRGPGSGWGKTSTRGKKGQWSRAGANLPMPLHEGGQMPLLRRIPKRGFNNARFRRNFIIVNVADLEAKFDEGATVDPEALHKVGLANGKFDGVRILGSGDLTKKLTVKASYFTKSAAEKITAKGGTTEIIPGPKKPKRNKMRSK